MNENHRTQSQTLSKEFFWVSLEYFEKHHFLSGADPTDTDIGCDAFISVLQCLSAFRPLSVTPVVGVVVRGFSHVRIYTAAFRS